jgi:hypothetical protein
MRNVAQLKVFWQRRKLGKKSDRTPGNVGNWRAPCKGGVFQWVQAPPGNRSSRKQSEQ